MEKNMPMPGAPPPYGLSPQGPSAYMQPQNVQTIYGQPQHVIIGPLPLGPESSHLTCPSCQVSISSRTEKESTTKTHLFALLLCLIFCPCGLIPYCTDSCKATIHSCPSCGAYLGKYDQ